MLSINVRQLCINIHPAQASNPWTAIMMHAYGECSQPNAPSRGVVPVMLVTCPKKRHVLGCMRPSRVYLITALNGECLAVSASGMAVSMNVRQDISNGIPERPIFLIMYKNGQVGGDEVTIQARLPW